MIWEKVSGCDRKREILVVAAVAAMLLASAVGSVAAHENESTANETTATPTPTPAETETATEDGTPTETRTEVPAAEEACEPGPNEPQMDQARLHASDKTIETDSPGRIAGGFQVSPTANCPVVVYITMSVPSGVTISGGSDFTSSGAGMVTTRFTVEPGANIKDIAAEVYSDEVGERTVTADIQYWPEGHEDSVREIDGLSFTFDVEEATTPADESDEGGSGDALAGGFTTAALVGALIAVVAAAVGRASDR